MTALLPGPLAEALARPDGARWVRCALQVNPFAYFASNGRPAPAPDQEAYDRDMVAALVEHDVRLIGLTDHWRARSSESLRAEATEAGITVLPGFEATSNEGVHLLVLFEPDTPCEEIEQRISECGHDFTTGGSEHSRLTFVQLLDLAAHTWRATVLAPHVRSAGHPCRGAPLRAEARRARLRPRAHASRWRATESADLAVTRRLVAASLVCGVRLQASLVLTNTATFGCMAVQVPST